MWVLITVRVHWAQTTLHTMSLLKYKINTITHRSFIGAPRNFSQPHRCSGRGDTDWVLVTVRVHWVQTILHTMSLLKYEINTMIHRSFNRVPRNFSQPLSMLCQSWRQNLAPARQSWPLGGQTRIRSGSCTPKCRILAAFPHSAVMLTSSKIPAFHVPQFSFNPDV